MKIQISAKCSDCCTVRVPELGLERHDGVPSRIGIGGGDYVRLTIDSETGKVEGWEPLTEEDLRDALEK